jgi:hypothetical protein
MQVSEVFFMFVDPPYGLDFKRERFPIIPCGYHLPNTLGEIEKMVGSHLTPVSKSSTTIENEPNLTFLGNLVKFGVTSSFVNSCK